MHSRRRLSTLDTVPLSCTSTWFLSWNLLLIANHFSPSHKPSSAREVTE